MHEIYRSSFTAVFFLSSRDFVWTGTVIIEAFFVGDGSVLLPFVVSPWAEQTLFVSAVWSWCFVTRVLSESAEHRASDYPFELQWRSYAFVSHFISDTVGG